MLSRMKLVLLASVAVFAVVFAFSAARADDKKKDKCEGCAQVKTVVEGMRCDGCKGKDKACDKCVPHIKKLAERVLCKGCKDEKCEACVKLLKDAKCKFCAAKAFVLAHQFCREQCEKAGFEKSQACAHCKKARDEVAAHLPKCDTCEKDKK